MVERHHRVVGHALEEAVEREDLWPVGILDSASLVVQGRNGGLELVGADRALGESGGHDRDALCNGALIPQASILLHQRDDLALRPASRRATRVGEQHQRKQARRLLGTFVPAAGG